MKRKNGFTLIELLAIIVILAIIAVITVPIILNIIDNAKRGAAKNSAYGYKDAVNKWYVSKLQDDNSMKLNGTYKIKNGTLNDIEIPISGEKPKNGTLVYSDNVLMSGCLTIGDYKLTFINGEVSTTEKGECEGVSTIPSCPGCVFALYHNSRSTKYIKGPYTRRGTSETLTDDDFSFADIDYTEDYTSLNSNFFLGVILDENELIERAFACGIYSNGTPFCIEGTLDGSKHASNVDLLNSEELWNGQCIDKWNDGSLICSDTMVVATTPDGIVQVRGIASSYGDICSVNVGGFIFCNL